MNKTKHTRLAATIKGAANPHRVNALFMLEKSPNLTLYDLADRLSVNFRTASEHTKKLVSAGLVNKSYSGQTVQHSLTPLGVKLVHLLNKL